MRIGDVKMKQYSPNNNYSVRNPQNKQQQKEKRNFLIIVACLLAILVIAGVAMIVKHSNDKKNAQPVDNTVSQTVAETVSDEPTSEEAETEEATTEGTTAAESTTAKALEFEVTDYSATMYANEELNVRSSPDASVSDNIIGKYEKDDEVTVTGKCSNGWLRVDYKGKAGYCSGNTKYLRSEKETATAPQNTNTDTNKASPYYITVNRTQNLVIIYGKDENGNHTKPIKAMVCSVGLNGKTELGTFQIGDQQGKPARSRWRQLTGGVYGQYISRFNGSILFHSVPYFSQSPSNLEYEEYNKLGQAASAGCVRLCVADAKWIYENCPDGTTVKVYDSSAAEPLGKPTPIRIDTNDSRKGWDPTDPDPNNPW